MKNIFLLLRKNIVIVFTMSFYILSIYFLFFDAKILLWLFFSVIFFLFTHFFLIEIKKTQITNLLLIISVITLFLLLVIWFHNFLYVLWIIFFNIWVFFLFWTIYDEIYNRIEISSYNLFTRWTKIYALFLSLSFSVAFLWTYRSFDLTCTQISSFTSNFSKHIFTKVWMQSHNIDNLKLKDIANYIWKDKSNKNLLTWDNLINTWSNLSWNILSWDRIKDIKNITFWSIVSIDFWKNVILNQIMENKTLLDKNVCNIIVWKIKTEYHKSGFQFTVMFLLFMLFYPIIRLFLFILSFINFIFFKLMNLSKIYKFKTIVDDVEVIE